MLFTEWLDAIDALADAESARGPDGRSYTQATGAECWLDAFEDGMTPDEAWSEEKIAGAA